MEEKKVIIYSTPFCGYCKKEKEFLKEQNIKFEEIDVSKDKEKAKYMVDKSGQMGVPVTEIDGKMIVGFDKEKLKEALGI
jgi:glutaredoxin 3